MEHFITLQWKPFSVPVDKLLPALRALLSSNFDGIVCRENDFDVVFLAEISPEDQNALSVFWDGVTEQQFSPTLREIISKSINDASVFGRAMILDAAVENVEMGITQAGKTREVANYCANVQRYLESGSLYAAVAEIDDLLAAGVPAELSPFITADRLNIYKTRINDYLATP